MTSWTYPRPITVAASGRHTATIIVNHGLGDSGAGWVFLAQEFGLKPKFNQVKWIFPNAPNRPITINMGTRMPGWYDITNFDSLDRSDDEEGVNDSKKYLHGLIKAEIDAGVPADRIVLGGFSQGAAMSLMAGLSYEKKLAGIFALSGYLLSPNKFQDIVKESGDSNKETKVFMGHGDGDQVVRYEWGQATADKLKGWGYDVDFNTYHGLPHSVAPEELADLENYLQRAVPAIDDKGSAGNL